MLLGRLAIPQQLFTYTNNLFQTPYILTTIQQSSPVVQKNNVNTKPGTHTKPWQKDRKQNIINTKIQEKKANIGPDLRLTTHVPKQLEKLLR